MQGGTMKPVKAWAWTTDYQGEKYIVCKDEDAEFYTIWSNEPRETDLKTKQIEPVLITVAPTFDATEMELLKTLARQKFQQGGNLTKDELNLIGELVAKLATALGYE
jgi:hypothetical protein